MATEKKVTLGSVFDQFHEEGRQFGLLIAEQDRIVKDQKNQAEAHRNYKEPYPAHVCEVAVQAAQIEGDRLRMELDRVTREKWVPALGEAMPAYHESHRFLISEYDLKIYGMLDELWAAIKTRTELSWELNQNSGELERLVHPHERIYVVADALPWGFVPQSADPTQRVSLNFSEIIKHFLAKRGTTFSDYKKRLHMITSYPTNNKVFEVGKAIVGFSIIGVLMAITHKRCVILNRKIKVKHGRS